MTTENEARVDNGPHSPTPIDRAELKRLCAASESCPRDIADTLIAAIPALLAELEAAEAAAAEYRDWFKRKDGECAVLDRLSEQRFDEIAQLNAQVIAKDAEIERLKAALREIDRGNYSACPFDDRKFKVEQWEPCPVCGDIDDLGLPDDDPRKNQPVKCHACGASARARSALSEAPATGATSAPPFFLPLSVKPLVDPSFDSGESIILDAETAQIATVSNREFAEAAVAALNRSAPPTIKGKE